MVTIFISEWFTYERILIRSFPEKMNAKSNFPFSQSDNVWIDAEKMTKKPPFYCHSLDVRSQICIEIAKIKKLKPCPLSKFIINQGHVLENANFDAGRRICDFTVSQCFFLRLKVTMIFRCVLASLYEVVSVGRLVDWSDGR